MSDIELVIKIDANIANGIIYGHGDEPRNIVRSFQATIADAIKNGIPLPKGYGRLGDLDKVKNKMLYLHDIGAEIETYGTEEVINYIFDDIQPIIEANKENK